jgi:hypothetical protein
MFFYNIMASHKTNKRSYKKRTPKRKTQKGGDFTILGYTCTEDIVDVGEADDSPDTENNKKENSPDTENIEEESDDANKIVVVGAGKKGRKSRKSTKKGRKPHKKNRKTMKKKSAWTTFVVDLYNKNKLKTKGYMFKNALSDAAKIYKK